MNQNCVKIQCGNSSGSGFFVAPEYIITCWHVIEGSEKNDEITCNYKNEEFTAVVIDFSEKPPEGGIYNEESADLALLKIKSLDKKPDECKYCRLDRVPGKNGQAFGYPHGNEGQKFTGEIEITDENDKGLIILDQANSVTTGYSGGPICRKDDPEIAIGVTVAINEVDEDGHGSNIAYCIPAEKVLKLWGDKDGEIDSGFVRERRYEVPIDEKNTFAYNSFKTEYKDYGKFLKKLNAFKDNQKNKILWWAIVDKWGSGKNRLAYEFARTLTSEWECRLLRNNELSIEKLQNIIDQKTPGKKLFLIIDQTYITLDKLGNWLLLCCDDETFRKRTPEVRVLILQQTMRPWLDDFYYEKNELRHERYKHMDPLSLVVENKKQFITDVMSDYNERCYHTSIPNNDYEQLYQRLKTIDPSERPVFAMFVVAAKNQNADIRTWDKAEEALENYCFNELNILDKLFKGIDNNIYLSKIAKCLRALATILENYEFPNIFRHINCHEKDLNTIKEKMDQTGFITEQILTPIEPPLLGEYFVATLFNCFNEMNDSEMIKNVIYEAFYYDSQNTCSFLTRLFSHYNIPEDICNLLLGDDNVDSKIRNSISSGLADDQASNA